MALERHGEAARPCWCWRVRREGGRLPTASTKCNYCCAKLAGPRVHDALHRVVAGDSVTLMSLDLGEPGADAAPVALSLACCARVWDAARRQVLLELLSGCRRAGVDLLRRAGLRGRRGGLR